MRDRLIEKLANMSVSRPGYVLIGTLIFTIIMAVLAGNIGVTMRWSDMLPEHDKRTIEFDRIIKEFESASSIVVVVQGDEARIKEFADVLAPRCLEPLLIPGKDVEPTVYVKRADYKQEVGFMREHGFMLMKEDDLKNMKDIFQDPGLIPLLTNINDSFEKEYIQPDEPMSGREEEDGALIFLNSIDTWLASMYSAFNGNVPDETATELAVDKFLLGEPYLLSYDRQALIMNLVPTFPITEMDMMINGTDAVQSLLDETLKDFPDVQAGLTGFIPLGRDEFVYGTQGMEASMLLAIIAIGGLLFITLRMWVAPLLAMTNLIIGLIWAAGLTSLLVEQLNVMTMMFMVILAGLGIDFSIHIISAFTENLALGKGAGDSMRKGMHSSGKGVMTGAVTTSFAFLALTIGDSRAMSEMGWVTGFGLLAVCVSSFTTLPAMLVMREKRKAKRLQKKGTDLVIKSRDISFTRLGQWGDLLSRKWGFTLVASVLITTVLVWQSFQIEFDYNYMNMEPEGIPSVTLQDTVVEKFDLSMDFAYLVAESVEESRALGEQAKDLNTVASVEDISLYLPSPEQQQKRMPHIAEIHESMRNASMSEIKPADLDLLVAEIERLEMNIIELQTLAYIGGQDKVYKRSVEIAGAEGEETIFTRIYDLVTEKAELILPGASAFQNNYSEYFRESVLSMTNTEPITLENLPETVVDRYANRDRNMFLVTALPTDNIWTDFTFLDEFTDDMESVSERATGMPPVFNALITIIARDGRNAAILTLLVVFVLLTIDFRNPGHALMAMLPLGAGVFWMVGFMALIGDMLDVLNVMSIPLIIGIGIDHGVHVMHRWRREGRGSAKVVFASTGKAILLSSLTTMIAFFSMVFSVYRGYASLGWALVVGVGACFLTSVIILPGIIGLIERRRS